MILSSTNLSKASALTPAVDATTGAGEATTAGVGAVDKRPRVEDEDRDGTGIEAEAATTDGGASDKDVSAVRAGVPLRVLAPRRLPRFPPAAAAPTAKSDPVPVGRAELFKSAKPMDAPAPAICTRESCGGFGCSCMARAPDPEGVGALPMPLNTFLGFLKATVPGEDRSLNTACEETGCSGWESPVRARANRWRSPDIVITKAQSSGINGKQRAVTGPPKPLKYAFTGGQIRRS